MGSSRVNLGHASHQHLCSWGPGLGVYGTPSSGPCSPPQHCRGMQHCTCMGTLQHHLCHTWATGAWAHPRLLSQSEMPRHGHVCPWHHCTPSVTHCGMGRGLSQAHPCTARCAHAESRPLQRQLRQTSSGTQRPRGTHLHKQHSSSFPTARGADKQPRSHPYVSSSLPPIAVCAQREWAVRRAPICACPLPCLDFPEHRLCWGRAG